MNGKRTMRVIYDEEVDVLRLIYNQAAIETKPFVRGPFAALEVAKDRKVVDVEVVGASAYLPLGRGYDAENDVLTIGETTDDPDMVTENGDFVGYWEVYERGPGLIVAIGVAIRRASVHLAPVIAALPRSVEVREDS